MIEGLMGMPATQLRDEVVTLWVAGQTTVAAALAWTGYLLAQHPEAARAVGHQRFAYFPFGGGPRACIGQNLAMLEMLVVLALMAQAYELCLVPRHPVEPEAMITLRPRHGTLMTLRHRQGMP